MILLSGRVASTRRSDVGDLRPPLREGLRGLLDTLAQDCEKAEGCADDASRDADIHFCNVRDKFLTLDSPLVCCTTSRNIIAKQATGAEPFLLACNHDWNRSQFATNIVSERLKEMTAELFRLRNSVEDPASDDRGPQVVRLWVSFREEIRVLSKWVNAAAEDTETVVIGEILRAQEARTVPRDIWLYLQYQTGVWESSVDARLGRLLFNTSDAKAVLRTSMPHVDRIDSVIFNTCWYQAFESATIVCARLLSVMSQAIIIDRYLNVTGPDDSVHHAQGFRSCRTLPCLPTLAAEVQAGASVDEKTEEFTEKDVNGLKRLFPNIQELVRGYILTAAVVTEKISGAGFFAKLFTVPDFPNTSGLTVLPLGLCNLPLKPGDSVWIQEPSRSNGCWSSNHALLVLQRLQREPIDVNDNGEPIDVVAGEPIDGNTGTKRKMPSP
jgi:hypothetical protein